MFVTFWLNDNKSGRTLYVKPEHWDSFCKMLGGVKNGNILFGGLPDYSLPFDDLQIEY